jgi:hypothetical protein
MMVLWDWSQSVLLPKRLLKGCRQFHLELPDDSGTASIQKLIKYVVTLISVPPRIIISFLAVVLTPTAAVSYLSAPVEACHPSQS